jgi:hypothetical protein
MEVALKKSAFKKILLVLGTMIGIFVLINLAWLFMIWFPYKHYCNRSSDFCTSEKITYNDTIAYNTYYDDNKQLGYKIYKPEYLSFWGLTLAIGDNRFQATTVNTITGEIVKNDEPLSLFNITLRPFKKRTYYLAIFDNAGANYSVTISKELEIIYALSEQEKDAVQKIIEQNRTHFEEIMAYATEMWNL